MAKFCAPLLAVILAIVSNGESRRYVDLTYALNKAVVQFPGRIVKFQTEIEGIIPGVGWMASRAICISEHVSTHMDAPYHFNKNGIKLNEIPFESFLDLPAVCIDVTSKINRYDKTGKLQVVTNYVATREDLLEWEGLNGEIPQRSLVFLRTGWGAKWGNADEYTGIPDEYKQNGTQDENAEPKIDLTIPLNHPGFDASAATFLTTERNVIGVGIDTLSLDPGNSKTFPAHYIFLNRGIYLLENVANLHLLPATGFRAWAVPFKIDAGTGAPTRVFAQILDPEDTKKP